MIKGLEANGITSSRSVDEYEDVELDDDDDGVDENDEEYNPHHEMQSSDDADDEDDSGEIAEPRTIQYVQQIFCFV